MKRQVLRFEASANLQRLIGRELVPNNSFAVIELVKNAYDSKARRVEIVIQPETKKEPGYIEFRDDGQGMTIVDLERLFMVAGYSERPEQLKGARRIPTGEKGIGRFATDKLGEELRVFTKVKGESSGIRLDIDWTKFSNKKKKFNEIEAPYVKETNPRFGKEESGTILTITHLRSEWSPSQLTELRHALSQLIDPFYSKIGFEIDLQVRGSEKFSGKIVQEKPERADIEIKFEVNSDGTIERRLSGSRYTRSSERSLAATPESKRLPNLVGRFFYWLDRPKKDATKGLPPAVRLYRDGFHIEPFGSPTADWLGIAEKRAKRAGHAHIVPTRLLGFIEISRKSQGQLVDTTSRQALLDSDAARALVSFLKEQIKYLEDHIKTDVAEPRWKENKRRQVAEFEQARLHTLNIMSVGLAHELRQPLQVIRSEAGNIKTRLDMLGVKDGLINSAQASIDTSVERIDQRINLIAELSKGNYETVERFDLANQVRSECILFKSTVGSVDLELRTNAPAHQEAMFNKSAVSIVLANLLENATSAIRDLDNSRSGIIDVAVTKKDSQHILTVTDNGIGIPKEIQGKIFKRFASKKTGGMGVGLVICHTLVTSLGGELQFTSRENVGSSFTVKFRDIAK